MRLAKSNKLTPQDMSNLTLKASMLPGSTITSVVLDKSDTWFVRLTEDKRPQAIHIGEASQDHFTPEMWEALTLHEAAHSSVTYYTANSDDWPQSICHQLTNILEDARMEHELEKEYPGSVPSFIALNNECFHQFQASDKRTDNKLEIKTWTDIFDGMLALKLGRFQPLDIKVINPTEEIALPNDSKRVLDLVQMWKDAQETSQLYVGHECKFFESESMRRSSNRFAVNRLNAFLDKYQWIGRNEKEKAQKLGEKLQKLLDQLGTNAKVQPGDSQPGDPQLGKPKKLDDTGNNLEGISKEKTAEEVKDEVEQLLQEMKPNPGGHSVRNERLKQLYNEGLAKELFEEVNKYFPVGPPPGVGYRFIQTARKRFPAAEGDLNMDAVIDYMASNKPKGMLLAKDSLATKKKSGELHRPPPRGTDFPIKRIAVFLDLSGSMHGHVGKMIAFSAAFSMFARKHKVDLMFVVGDQGLALVKQGSPKDMLNVLEKRMGNQGNEPTWKAQDMKDAANWAKENGRSIYITDRFIPNSELQFIDHEVAQKRAVCVGSIEIQELADVLWMRKTPDVVKSID
jgi:hypothetical protein